MVRGKDTKENIRKEKRDSKTARIKKGVKSIICKQKVRKAEADLRRK